MALFHDIRTTVPADRASYLRVTAVMRPVAAFVLMALAVPHVIAADENVQFNTDVLDVKDRSRIDLDHFSREGYMMPGEYQLTVQVNKTELPEQTITFYVPDDDPKGSDACITPEMTTKLGLKEGTSRGLRWWHKGQCLDLHSLDGMVVRADLGSGVLYVSVPQVYLEYTADNWDPPSRWDNGVVGALFDYNINAMNSHQSSGGQQESVSGNGVSGANLGAWRFRADWQAEYNHDSGQAGGSRQSWTWSRYYLYRAVTSLKAKMVVGESYLPSSMFDSFRFTGISLTTDDSQLPPNLRGYAPEITGVAKTNAKVTVSQQDRVLYETTVAAGPFRIQDLNDSVTGKLDVKVLEQDGSVQTWQVDTASIPYLSRPGLVRYKISAGKPSDVNHHIQGPQVSTGEFSWGVDSGWSLYGGGMFAGDYNALAVGIGRDLLSLGAVSLDITQARAEIPGFETKQGGSYRLSYSKRFDEYDSQITFAGYRFSERNYMSMSQYLDARYRNNSGAGGGKELYTISLNKQFRDINLSSFLNYSYQTYWERPASDAWSGSLSTYFDVGDFHDVSLSVSASRSQVNGKMDDAVYLSLSLPWGNNGNIDYSGQFNNGVNHSVGYYGRIDENNNYRISAGTTSDGHTTGNGYFTHEGDIAQVSANTSFRGSDYSAYGVSLQGGATATLHGAALHRTGNLGGTRMMVDTDGVSGVPVGGGSGVTRSNLFGKAVVSDVSSYYRNSINVDMDKLSDDVDATRSVIQDTLTEGAIGYRKFGILSGQKAMAIIKSADGTVPPFGATVSNNDNVQTGITGDDGRVWLSGMKPGESMAVSWGGKVQCSIHLPEPLNIDLTHLLLLPCEKVKDRSEQKLQASDGAGE
ncbi:outer membrane usher protein [Enterobacter sp. DRP3]|nr:outer membrane usher protein [Enterobacter sp. DRP3]